jgi:hypothetical protein
MKFYKKGDQFVAIDEIGEVINYKRLKKGNCHCWSGSCLNIDLHRKELVSDMKECGQEDWNEVVDEICEKLKFC